MTENESKQKKKLKLLLKPRQIVYIVVAVLVTVVMIVADYFANKYSAIISTYLGVGVQLEGDTDKVEEGAKSGDEVVRKLADEGVALLKNENLLPLAKTNRKINIFGWGATDAGFLLTGNGSGKSIIHEDNKVTLLQAFKQSGFTYNEEIITLYEKHRKDEDGDWGESGNWGERRSTTLKEPVTSKVFTDEVTARAKEFSDTAAIVISRYSGEFLGRLASTQKKYGLPEDKTREYNELSAEEESLVKLVTSNFKNVIVIFNTGSIFDMTFVDNEAEYGHIGAVMNVGYMGQSGATAVPKILTGDVVPSGKLADTVVYEPKQNEIARTTVLTADTVYTEDIYLGYKFYETADVEGYFDGKTFLNKSGYDAVVQYPFGHGLSYTTFDWEIVSASVPDGEVMTKTTEFRIDVKVTNTGMVAGKDVVQLYFTPPYYKGGIEKSAIQLLDFAKTKELAPGASDTVSFEFTPYELASYDCYDKNENGATGWELDVGDYQIRLMTDSHHAKTMKQNTLTYKVEDFAIRFRKDPVSNGRIKNRFTGMTAYGECPIDGSTLGTDWKYLSRADFAGTRTIGAVRSPANSELVKYSSYYYDAYNYSAMPVTGTDGGLRLVTKSDGSYVSKKEFDGGGSGMELVYNDELIQKLGDPANWKDPVWSQFLDQLTPDELRAFVEDGGYGTRSVESIGKPQWLDYDGPSGFNNTNLAPNVKGSKMTALPAENLVAQTWNKDLVLQAGQIIGMDGQNFGLAGIYAPGINLHREYLNGRNYEYYSEDPILSGYLAASFCLGAKSNGVYCFAKHLALFDSSPLGYERAWCTEQNLRENYLKPFEIAIKKGGATGVMVSFNNMGATWTGANKELLDGILRTEFGFKGMFVTDFDMGNEACWDLRKGVRAGLNTQLNPAYGNADKYGRLDMSNATDVNLARESAKSIVYAYCNTYRFAKSDALKTEYSVEIAGPRAITKGFEWWILLVVLMNVVAFGLLVWRGLFNFVPALQRFSAAGKEKRIKKKQERALKKAAAEMSENAVPQSAEHVADDESGKGSAVAASADELAELVERMTELERRLNGMQTELDLLKTKTKNKPTSKEKEKE